MNPNPRPGAATSARRSFIYFYQIIRSSDRLREHARTASLHGIDLRLSPGETTEAGRKLGAVEKLASLGLDGAEGCARVTTDGAIEGGATERAVLLSLGAIGSERVGECAGGRGRVHARRVIN